MGLVVVIMVALVCDWFCDFWLGNWLVCAECGLLLGLDNRARLRFGCLCFGLLWLPGIYVFVW